MSLPTSSGPALDDEKPLTPEQARLVARAKWLMLLSGIATLLGIVVIFGIIGYRFLKAEESSAAAADVTAALPKGARIVATGIADNRLIVTLDIGGATEIRTFELRGLKPVGRLRFATEP